MTKEREEHIAKFAAEFCGRATAEVYADYRDFDGVADVVARNATRDDFEWDVIESYRECADDAIADALVEARKELCKELGVASLEEDEAELLQSEVWPEITVCYPIDQFMAQRVRVALMFKGSASAPHEVGFDEGAIQNLVCLLSDQGVPCSDNFKRTLDEEIAEAKESGSNVLVALATVTVGEYYDLVEQPLNHKVRLCQDHYIGLYDPWAGGGSKMGINLPGFVDVPADCFTAILVENSTGVSKGFYTPDSVYGFTDRAYVETKVL